MSLIKLCMKILIKFILYTIKRAYDFQNHLSIAITYLRTNRIKSQSSATVRK